MKKSLDFAWWARTFTGVVLEGNALPQADIVFLDASQMIVQSLKRVIEEYSPSTVMLVADGPVPTAKARARVDRARTMKAFPGMTWESKIPDSLADTFTLIEEISAANQDLQVVFSHKLVYGEADCKIPQLYRRWATEKAYEPGLTYVIDSTDIDLVLVALGFHESSCYWRRGQQMIDIGALRQEICSHMGGGNVVRRVDDFRALTLFQGNDYHTGCGCSMEDLIDAYRNVTDPELYLVDGDEWNVEVLKELLEEAAPSQVGASEADEVQCITYFKYLAWALQFSNGFCPDWDFFDDKPVPAFTSLVVNISHFSSACQFEENMEKRLPPTILKLVQEVIPKNAPEVIQRHADDVFAGLFRRNADGVVERNMTLQNAIELYEKHLRDDIIREFPMIGSRTIAMPRVFINGQRSRFEVKRVVPDFESPSRNVPRSGSVVIYRRRCICLFNGLLYDGVRCSVTPYHIDSKRAVPFEPITCRIDELEWANGGTPVDTEDVNEDKWFRYVLTDPRCFGTVGSFARGIQKPGTSKGMIIYKNQMTEVPQQLCTKGANFRLKCDLRHRIFRQLSPKEISALCRQVEEDAMEML